MGASMQDSLLTFEPCATSSGLAGAIQPGANQWTIHSAVASITSPSQSDA
ncbi:predicted protein [Plenodomus lingam JN3]|uniref:Predicted protein n=1 Tax=Leptosphaeria maculans (strain JN3 / isolate v23.1.3 / race Av1-4-5-6-7-8) TaxID=985895 RepID=E4ZRT3_LEPMJ|nr:predicted protein [Plenodomus lingam JN3]CBX93930.1 predicted protein [Plenodomus lingam JN3]